MNADDYNKEFGANLKTRRKKMGLSQTELGKAVGVTFQQVQKYERGTNRVSIGTGLVMAGALNTTLSELLPRAENQDNTASLTEILNCLPPAKLRVIQAVAREMGA
jgi:transcriptional regulator with XRE-family HTH domain